MPRRGGVPKREVLPDPIYNSVVVTKLINQIMKDGKGERRKESATMPLTSSRIRRAEMPWKFLKPA